MNKIIQMLALAALILGSQGFAADDPAAYRGVGANARMIFLQAS